MSSICEHIFEDEDSNDPGYSLTEFDLQAKLGLSIRKNLVSELYEIFDTDTREVRSRGSLGMIVDEANQREGRNDIKIRCRESCPK